MKKDNSTSNEMFNYELLFNYQLINTHNNPKTNSLLALKISVTCTIAQIIKLLLIFYHKYLFAKQ